jgi:methyl-accepting chemotaxis protein
MRNRSIRWQLIGAFTILSATLVLSTVAFSAWLGHSMMQSEAELRLTNVRESRQSGLEAFLQRVESRLQTLAERSDVTSALEDFSTAALLLPSEMTPKAPAPNPDGTPAIAPAADPFPAAVAAITNYYDGPFATAYSESNGQNPPRTLRPTEPIQVWMQAHYIANNPNGLGERHAMMTAATGTTYDEVHTRYHELFRVYLERFDFNDIFLVDGETGRIVYSVFKEVDFGSDLRIGPYAESGIAEVTQAAMRVSPGSVVFTDFTSYTPNYGAPAAFMATPIATESGSNGVLVVQFPASRLNEVMANTTGLGETGRSFIVGGEDMVVRSQLRGYEENTVLTLQADTQVTRNASSGPTEIIEAESFDGKEMLMAASELTFLGVTWVTVAEIETQEAFASLREMLQWQIVVSAFLMMLGLLGGYFLSRSIALPIAVVSERLTRLAEGRFAPAIETSRGDEVGQLNVAYNKLSTRLQSVIQDMQSAAVGLSSSAEQLMGNVQAQQSGATEQAAAVEQTKQSVHLLLESANSIATLGENVLLNAKQAQSNAGVIGSRIHELSSKSATITEVLELIKDIANKSEMLALNAALEGTKAGDAGRGFSLVATQMQRLAEQVMGSAKRIQALTADINTASAASVLASEEAAKLAIATTLSAEEITSAVSAQQAGTTEVDAAMDGVNEVARRSVGVAREMVTSANSLRDLSESLKGHVALFDFTEVANITIKAHTADQAAA